MSWMVSEQTRATEFQCQVKVRTGVAGRYIDTLASREQVHLEDLNRHLPELFSC